MTTPSRQGGTRIVTAIPQRTLLSDFLATRWTAIEQLEGLDLVITAIAKGARSIQRDVQAAGLADVLGVTGDTNVQGEIVQRLDTLSSDTFVDVLRDCGHVAIVGCEELENPEIVGDSKHHAYMVMMDPLDGSSNIDVAVSIGSIFGIWRRTADQAVTENVLLRPGREQVAAAYLVYGSSTVLVVATHDDVNAFTLNADDGEFYLTHPGIRIPSECPYYSANDGNYKTWDDGTRVALTNLRDTYSLRYVGSLVADFHRNLLKGGIFLYPADKSRPEGRLRLMYEANPLAFVAEQAGGAASTGQERILDVQPERLHQRSPLILGNKDVVEHAIADIGSR